MITQAAIEAILERQDVLHRHAPHCPECTSRQVQVMDKAVPAQWRCRMCRHRFTFEPNS